MRPFEVVRRSRVRNETVQVSRLYPDGFLCLELEGPERWIRDNPADCLSVRILELDLFPGLEIGDSIGKLSNLTHLSIFGGGFKRLPNSILSLPNLQRLELSSCIKLQELPANLGDLKSLTYLSLPNCPSIKSLPHSIANLSKLTTLHLDDLEDLPAYLGDLSNLTFLQLSNCKLLTVVPAISNLVVLILYNCHSIQSIAKGLYNLERLDLKYCESLTELPADLNVLYLKIDSCCSIHCLPQGLCNLERLDLKYCESLTELPADLNVLYLKIDSCCSIHCLPQGLCNMKQLHLRRCESLTKLPIDLNVSELRIEGCCNIQSLPEGLCNLKQLHLPLCSKQMLTNLTHLVSLCHLTLHICNSGQHSLAELPANLCELSKLSVLNIQDTAVKWLPWSITKLSKLHLLILSKSFRLETLPKHLNDSVVISVKDKHIRKTWEELKTEIELFSTPIVGVEAAQFPSTPCTGDPGTWTQSYCSHSFERILELELGYSVFDRNIINSIGKLPEFTHLYISYGIIHNLPLTLTRLTHLSLFTCDIRSRCDRLGKLSTLQSLTMIKCIDSPDEAQMDLPVSLRHMDLPVSLRHFALAGYRSLPPRYMASMRKLTNLNTLDLCGFEDLELSYLIWNLTKLKIRDCTIKSLPGGLQHLEIIHSKCSWWWHACSDRKDKQKECGDQLQLCLNQLVNLETLSITCHWIKVIPSIVRPQSLQELQFKDCFNLKKLPEDLDKLVKLGTLNVSGTRIKYLPRSITKLQNLRHLILPKCFVHKSLPKNFNNKVRVFDDDTDDMYYQHAGYYDSDYGFDDDNEITSESMEGGDEVASQKFNHDNIIEQGSSHSLLNLLPDATQVHEVVQLDGPNQHRLLSIISSTFVVEATFGKDTVRFDFSLSSSMEKLKEEVGKRLELDVGKFKMKYLDEDKDLILIIDMSDLEHALCISSSSGSNVVTLPIILEM